LERKKIIIILVAFLVVNTSVEKSYLHGEALFICFIALLNSVETMPQSAILTVYTILLCNVE